MKPRVSLLGGVLLGLTGIGAAVFLLAMERLAGGGRGVPALFAAGRYEASPAPACRGPTHREFDFWLGSWEVTQEILAPDGSYLELSARSSVQKTLGGCALLEVWRGRVQFFWQGMTEPDSLRALSVRSFDREATQWRIHRMDSRDPVLGEPFVGGFEGGVGTFTRETRRPDGDPLLSRIRFRRPGPDRVDRELAVSTDGGATWTTLWVMRFRRPSESPRTPAVEPDEDAGTQRPVRWMPPARAIRHI